MQQVRASVTRQVQNYGVTTNLCDLFIVDHQDSADIQVTSVGCVKHGFSIFDIDCGHAHDMAAQGGWTEF